MVFRESFLRFCVQLIPFTCICSFSLFVGAFPWIGKFLKMNPFLNSKLDICDGYTVAYF